MARKVEPLPRSRRVTVSAAATTSEFVECLRTLFAGTTASYRDLERVGRKSGFSIAATTVHNMVTGKTAPTSRSLIHFLRACGVGVEEEQAWLGKHDELYSRSRASAGPGKTAATSDPRWIRRSRYVQQVGDIAPIGGARGRKAELSELADFCVGDEPYVWWQAPPWAGKSALMSTFVLDPPPGVQVVSFFVTGRLAAQATSTAFTDAVLEQLTALTGEDLPPTLSPGQRDGYRRALLETAAVLAEQHGQRLVLVVDGLDEDQGGGPASGIASIASLLPKQPPSGLRIILAGRPDPDIPKDVARDHPIRTCRRRTLEPSSYAGEIAELAQRELDELLVGSTAQRDLVGLITASGGGLTLPEIQELTGLGTYAIESMLNGVCGRTVAGRADFTLIDHRRLFLFTHETLLKQAEQRLGVLVDGYRQRIYDWAETYRDKGWPASTPPYLLHGYFQMLSDRCDLVRMLDCATDPGRHDRMLDLTGGDAAALVEVRTLQNLLIEPDELNLAALARLCVRRLALIERNANIPVRLPAVWAMIGHVTRADALILAIADEYQRARALIVVAGVVAAAGSGEQVSVLSAHAQEAAHTITDAGLRSWVLTELASACAAADDSRMAVSLLSQAQGSARAITDPERRAWASAVLARLADRVGDQKRAVALTRAADEAAHAIVDRHLRADVLAELKRAPGQSSGEVSAAQAPHVGAGGGVIAETDIDAESLDPEEQAELLTDLARAAAEAGDRTHAADLCTRAEVIARTITQPGRYALALGVVAQVVSQAGDFDRAESIVRAIPDTEQRVAAAGELMAAVTGTERAQRIAGGITDSDRLTWALIALAKASATDSDHRHAAALTTMAEGVALTIADPDGRTRALVELAGSAMEAGDFGRAESIARAIPDPRQQTQVLVKSALAAARTGNHERVSALGLDPDRIVGSIADASQQVQQLVEVAKTLDSGGERERAGPFIAKAESVLPAIVDETSRTRALIGLAEALGRTGDFGRAEELATSVTGSYERTQAVLALVQLFGRAGDIDRAAVLIATIIPEHERAQAWALVAGVVGQAGDVGRAESIAHAISDVGQRDNALAALAMTAGRAGDVGRAESIARAISDVEQRDIAVAGLVDTLKEAGDLGRAGSIAGAITDPYRHAWVLIDLAKVSVESDDRQRTADLTAAAQAAATTIADESQQSRALADLVKIAVATGDVGLAESIARTIPDQADRNNALAELAAAVCRTGDLDRAERAGHAIDDPDGRIWTLIDLATAAVAAGDRARAARLSGTIVAASQEHLSGGGEARALTALLDLIVIVRGDDCVVPLAARAEKIARFLDDDEDFDVLVDLAAAVSRAGHPDCAAAIYRRVEQQLLDATDPQGPVDGFMILARSAHETGDVEKALAFTTQAMRMAWTISDPDQQAEALTDLAKHAADAGHDELAESIARRIADPGSQAEALNVLVPAVEPQHARQLLGLALSMDDWRISVHNIAETDLDVIDGVVNQIRSEMDALGGSHEA